MTSKIDHENSGKKFDQKMKPYLVYRYLLEESDENNIVGGADIAEYIKKLGISAERRSVYKDIDAINKAFLMLDEGMTAEEAEEYYEEYPDEGRIAKVKGKGFYVRQRDFEPIDLSLMAQCIYSAKFLSESEAERLATVLSSFVSVHQKDKIFYDAILTDRVKTNNKSVLSNIMTINDAMSRQIDGEKHVPEKISFKYLSYSMDDVSNFRERRNGGRYVTSPYALLINDGNYYLLAYDDKKQDIITYRVDRMKDVRLSGEPREGKEAFEQLDMKSYTKRVFSMFGGEKVLTTIQFVNGLLDTVVDRFGNDKRTMLSKVDENHFKITVPVEVSDQFFGWICGFGKKAVILEPQSVVDKFTTFVDGIRSKY